MKLEHGPFRVSLAYDGQQALDSLEREPDVALVLLDVMSPTLSGLDVLAAMRSSGRWRETPCIILTAAGEEEYQRRALALGASEFLTKPFSPKRLYARVAELVGFAADDTGAVVA